MTDRVYLVTRLERAWHWTNALGFLLLVLSGLNIHFARDFNLFGTLSTAMAVHNVTGLFVTVDYLVWAIYMVRSRRLRYYLPGRDDLGSGLVRQARYYLAGIFRGAPHPFEEGKSRKFNPLQKWTYLGVMAVLLPLQVGTGLWLLYLIYRWQLAGAADFRILGVTHTVGAVLLTVFLVIHLYLATTGATPGALVRMMVTGYAEPHPESTAHEEGTDT